MRVLSSLETIKERFKFQNDIKDIANIGHNLGSNGRIMKPRTIPMTTDSMVRTSSKSFLFIAEFLYQKFWEKREIA